jgi:thiamine biosynthesis lipoprotein
MFAPTPRSVLVLLLTALGAGFVLVGPGHTQPVDAPAPRANEFSFHRDHVIGTSLDLCIVAPDAGTAEDAELTVLNEIERLRTIFSTYDATTEISKLNRTREPVRVSADMAEVLKAYEFWQGKSGGAFNGQVGELVRVWKDGEKANREPAPLTLERIAADLKKPGWQLDPVTNTVTRLTDQPLNLNAIGKGFIIQKAFDAVQKQHSTVSGLLINLGGDIRAWGTPPGGTGWAVGVQDPFRHFDNAAPLAGLRITN